MMIAIALLGCDNEYTPIAEDRYLDSYSYVDAGAVNIGERQTFTVPLFSKADGALRIFDVVLEDIRVPRDQVGTAFLLDDVDWADPNCDAGDEASLCRDLEGYDADSDADTFPLAARFAPTAEGYFEGILTVWSNDTRTTETAPLPDDPEGQEFGIWRVQLRGISKSACGTVFPTFVDYGRKAEGGDFSSLINVVNCGLVSLTVSAINVDPPGSHNPLTLVPLYVNPGDPEPITMGWTVGAYTDGVPTPDGATVTFEGNSTRLGTESVTIIGNDCSQSSDPSWDSDGDGFFLCGGDCDDDDPYANPSVSEVSDDLVDNDCDGATDEAANPIGSDDDGDGANESGSLGTGTDCNDADAAVSPSAVKVVNQLDDDCNGFVDDHTDAYDDDGDGYTEVQGDCDDAAPLVFPGAEEAPNDGVDNDCDDTTDEGGTTIDDDEDGFSDIEADTSTNDCDDQDPWVYVGAREYCDAYDNDCDGLSDEGNEEDEGGLDADGGACAFIPSRDTVASSAADDSGAPAASSGCNAAGLPVSFAVTLGAALLVRRRPRD